MALGARGLVAGWAGQSSVLVPWGCDCGCSPGFLGHLPSIGDLGGINEIRGVWIDDETSSLVFDISSQSNKN